MIRFVLFLSCVFFALTSSYAVNCEQSYCVAVVDAGSTGSRLHIFSYDIDENRSPINITERWSKKIKPGFATIEATPDTIDAYLGILLADAPIRNVPVYFYATAGMRLLSKPKQQQLYSLVENWFKNNQDWHLKSARTITGMEEGLFGWLSINYQLDRLSGEKARIGVMDMGGASVQVAFPVGGDTHISNQDLQEFDLYGQHFKLFIHSFLGLGQTEVSHQFLDSSACFITNYELPTGQFAEGDAFLCENEISELMNVVHKVNNVVHTALTENPVEDWYVMGGLVDLAKSQPFSFQERHFSSQALLDKADTDICHQQWSTLSAQYSDNDYLYGYCLFSAYYYALIVEGYGLNPSQNLNYLEANQNNDWTLGAVLYQPHKDSENIASRIP